MTDAPLAPSAIRMTPREHETLSLALESTGTRPGLDRILSDPAWGLVVSDGHRMHGVRGAALPRAIKDARATIMRDALADDSLERIATLTPYKWLREIRLPKGAMLHMHASPRCAPVFVLAEARGVDLDGARITPEQPPEWEALRDVAINVRYLAEAWEHVTGYARSATGYGHTYGEVAIYQAPNAHDPYVIVESSNHPRDARLVALVMPVRL